MFICAEFDPQTLDCIDWVQYTGFLPPLSIDQAMQLGTVTVLSWATAYALNMLVRFLWSQNKPGGDTDER